MLSLLNTSLVRNVYAAALIEASIDEANKPGATKGSDPQSEAVFAAAEAKTLQVLDAALAFKNPLLEKASDLLLAAILETVIGAIDTPAERQALWADLVGTGRSMRQRLQAAKAARQAARQAGK